MRATCFSLILSGIVLFLSGCAPGSRLPTIDPNLTANERDKQMEMALRENMRRAERLYSVSWRILTTNVDSCGETTTPKLGLWMAHEETVDKGYINQWRKLFGEHKRMAVVMAPAGTPGVASGLLPGDVVMSVDGIDTGSKESREKIAALLEALTDRPIELRTMRGNVERMVSLTPVRSCNYPPNLTSGDEVNAYADGKKIYVTNGMMRFATSDEELALVVGHELAHNTQGHMAAKMGNQMIGGLIAAAISVAIRADVTNVGTQIGAGAFSQEFESEADYVGTYFAAKSGFAVERSPEFWRRMAVEHPKAIGHGTSHPATAQRFVSIEAAVKEINEKRAAGLPLVPEKK